MTSSDYDYECIKAMGHASGRSIETLIAMTAQNDPFYITPQRRASAEWFAKFWHELGFAPGTHVRRIQPYLNTVRCQSRLINASRDARYLELVPEDHFDDRRNDEPTSIWLIWACEQHWLWRQSIENRTPLPHTYTGRCPPSPTFSSARLPSNQRYQIELWCEKTTMNEILLDLARQYHCNIITASGEISETRCYQLIQRARRWRPVRILYLSDFDPAGVSIPCAGARKIEFLNRKLGFDIQLRQIALTHEQCVQYRLPRTPIKDSETRGEQFEERFGEGGTELDALEAIHPGELRQIIENEILRYYDSDLSNRVEEQADQFREDVEAVRDEIIERYADERDAIEREHQELIRRCNAALARFRRPLEQIGERHQQLQERIVEALNAEAPDPDSVEWPEPETGDEDDDPLFDSKRDYLDQIERYKEHQGKSTTERRPARLRERLNTQNRARRAAARVVRP
jgi:hypothetical protein